MLGKHIVTAAFLSLGFAASALAQTVPANPFFKSALVNSATPNVIINATSTTVGVTSITLVNYNTGDQQVHIGAFIYSGANCTGTAGGTSNSMQVIVPPKGTLNLTFPTPWTFKPLSGQTCIRVTAATVAPSNVQVYLTGFTQ